MGLAPALQPLAYFIPARSELVPQFVAQNPSWRTHSHAVVFQPDAGTQGVEVHQQFSTTHISSSSSSSVATALVGCTPCDVKRSAWTVTFSSCTVAAAKTSRTESSTPKVARTRLTRRVAISECPPKAK